MKIGIMGGTFDPIHNGHLMLGHAAYETFSLDQIWFMPNGNPPHKKGNITDKYDLCFYYQLIEICYYEKENYVNNIFNNNDDDNKCICNSKIC